MTSQFWDQGDFVAEAGGMPELPRLQLPHPVAGTGATAMTELARQIAPDIVARLRGAAPVAA